VKGHVMQCSCPSKGLGSTSLKTFIWWVVKAFKRNSCRADGCKERGRNIEGDSDTNGGGERN
jgi:hypothetical protein